jgi:hypothetical protein
VLFGLNRLSVVAVAMKNDLIVCSHCRRNFRVRLSDDAVLLAHWVGDYYLIDIGLFFEGFRLLFLLYWEVYVAESKRR